MKGRGALRERGHRVRLPISGRLAAARSRAATADGYTLSEMLVVLAILGVILAALTQLLVSATTAQADMSKRFDAQQNARIALDRLRGEIHCATTVAGTPPASSVTVTLGSYCPTYSSGQPLVTWCTQTVATNRYALWRYPGSTPVSCGVTAGGVRWADYLTTATVFTAYAAAGGGNLAKLTVVLPVDPTPNDAKQRYTLSDDIALRNSARS